MRVFGQYAGWYDLFYADKNYSTEVRFVDGLIRERGIAGSELLEIGCGTGAHAEIFVQQGWRVTGVDISADMLAGAVQRFDALAPELKERVTFFHGDARTFDLGHKFDAVISLFHVMSYQAGQDDVRLALKTARRHMRPGGVFVFDFWYGPAVLTQLPETRFRCVENDCVVVRRFATPVLRENENVVEVNYDFVVTDKIGNVVQELQETHRMRYLFLPEIRAMASEAGFEVIKAVAWITGDEPSRLSWNVCVVLQNPGAI